VTEPQAEGEELRRFEEVEVCSTRRASPLVGRRGRRRGCLCHVEIIALPEEKQRKEAPTGFAARRRARPGRCFDCKDTVFALAPRFGYAGGVFLEAFGERMGDVIEFVNNHEDLSTDRGYQFKFFCDHCGNGYLSSFDPSMLGMASGLLGAASSLFGGLLGQASDSAAQLQETVGGKARDAALQKAVREIKQKFRHCPRCGRWVCPEACWNARRDLCGECAPNLAEEAAAAQAQAAREQVHEKARATNLVGDVDMAVEASAGCPSCGAEVGAAKFCPECGEAINRKVDCASCGAKMAATVKFCPECGKKRARS
jgi:hypothetical protein